MKGLGLTTLIGLCALLGWLFKGGKLESQHFAQSLLSNLLLMCRPPKMAYVKKRLRFIAPEALLLGFRGLIIHRSR